MTESTSTSKIDESGIDYASALVELDTILAELEDETLNVDLLAERVARASELITFCRSRITDAKLQVEQIVSGMDSPSDQPTS